MNPFLWVIIALFIVDALREYTQQPSLPAFIDYILTLSAHYMTI